MRCMVANMGKDEAKNSRFDPAAASTLARALGIRADYVERASTPGFATSC